MEYLQLEIEINSWEGRSYEIIGRSGEASARQISRFPLSPAGLHARLPALRRVLARVDLGAGRSADADERAVEEFAGLLYRFIFSGELKRLFDEVRTGAVQAWKGLRLCLQIVAPDLQAVPWEVLWDILAFDLQSMKRGMFDLRVERQAAAAGRSGATEHRGVIALRPTAAQEHHRLAFDLLRQADAAFYAPDFAQAAALYHDVLRFAPELPQASEFLARAETCLQNCHARTTVPPRAAAGYRKAWETYTLYRFDEALRWLNEAWLQARDWGIAEWPEAHALHAQIEHSRAGFANYQEALARSREGDMQGALEAIEQAYRADPLEVYRSQFESWSRAFDLG
jgi:hypothetical protein